MESLNYHCDGKIVMKFNKQGKCITFSYSCAIPVAGSTLYMVTFIANITKSYGISKLSLLWQKEY